MSVRILMNTNTVIIVNGEERPKRRENIRENSTDSMQRKRSAWRRSVLTITERGIEMTRVTIKGKEGQIVKEYVRDHPYTTVSQMSMDLSMDPHRLAVYMRKMNGLGIVLKISEKNKSQAKWILNKG